MGNQLGDGFYEKIIMLLYGNIHSGHSYKVRSLLLLTKTAHRYQAIDLSLTRSERPAEFIAASQFGEVPVLLDDGRSLCQSNAILQYLAQKTKQFCGTNSEEWQNILEWLAWESNRIGFSVPNLRYCLLWDKQAPEVIAYLRQRAVHDLQVLDHTLAKRDFLNPSGASIADISCSAYLYWLHQAELAISDYPHVQSWLHRLSALPGWQHPNVAMASSMPYAQ